MQTKFIGLRKALPLLKNFVPHPSLNFFSTSEKPAQVDAQSQKTPTFFQKYFGPHTYIAKPNFKKRWLITVPCVLNQICIGSPYAWSIVAGYF